MTSRRPGHSNGPAATKQQQQQQQQQEQPQSDVAPVVAKHVSAQQTDPEWKLGLSEALSRNVRAGVAAPWASARRLLSGGLPAESMTWAALSNAVLTSGYVPDAVLYAGVRHMIGERVRSCHALNLEQLANYKNAFVADLKQLPSIAQQTAKANEQHYEVPYAFFELVLGARLKYSSCLYEDLSNGSLNDAEVAMLELYRHRAQLAPGQRVLDLGCGWGSLTLYFAAAYPTSHFVAVSNSQSQKELILARARKLGLTNVEVVTQDVNTLTKEHVLKGDLSGQSKAKDQGAVSTGHFDRVLSIEMMEHCKNYEMLFALLASILKPGGKMFSHIFVSREYPYHFVDDSWMTRYFFSGGTMPSDDLFLHFQKDLQLKSHWRVNGCHYARTLRQWQQRMEARKPEVLAFFKQTYGSDAAANRWYHMWRMFFMSCAVFFGWNNGEEFFVAHYLFEKPAAQ